NGRDAGAILQHRAKRRTDAYRDRATDNRHATEKIHRQVDEMHRAALARRAAVDLSIELGEHRAQIAALADVMGVRAMRADDVVLEVPLPADAGGDCLLADAEMRWTAHVAFGIERLDALLDAPNFQHRAIECEADFARRSRWLLVLLEPTSRRGARRNH